MTKILMIEDEARIRAFVVPYLTGAGFAVDEAGDGLKGLEMALSGDYALILLDLMLPGLDGKSVCAKIRKTSKVPILMLTARSEEDDVITGFELGADDYLSKPFSPRELTARVKALLSRCAPEAAERVAFGGIEINTASQQASADGEEIALTPKEYELLLLLLKNPNKTFSRDQLLSSVWGYEFYGDTRTVDTHVKQLREKLGDKRGLIVTVWGKGYRLGE